MKSKDINSLPIIKNIENNLSQIEQYLPFIHINDLMIQLQFIISQFLQKLPNYLFVYSKDIAGFFSYFVIVPVTSFFILKDMTFFKKSLYQLIPNRYFEICIILLNRINTSISTYLKTLIIEVTIVGGMTAFVLTLLGVKFGILIGLIAGLFNIIPYLGPFSAALFASLSVLLTGKPLSMVVYTILAMWGVQIIDNNIVFPLVMAKGTEIHPLYVFLTAIAGGLTFGFIGMILALPTLYLVRGVLEVLYRNLKDFDII
jgi:predicted PurR-regulated permease PerM